MSKQLKDLAMHRSIVTKFDGSSLYSLTDLDVYTKQNDRETGRQTDGQTGRWADRLIDRQTQKQTDREPRRRIDRQFLLTPFLNLIKNIYTLWDPTRLQF